MRIYFFILLSFCFTKIFAEEDIIGTWAFKAIYDEKSNKKEKGYEAKIPKFNNFAKILKSDYGIFPKKEVAIELKDVQKYMDNIEEECEKTIPRHGVYTFSVTSTMDKKIILGVPK